jgi:hypothetical protein
MSRRVKIYILSFLLISVICLSFPTIKCNGESWLTGWLYRKSITINSLSGASSGYQLNFTIFNSTGTDLGYFIYIENKTNSNFSDIRFTDNDGNTLLNIWCEVYYSQINATYWVKIADNLDSSNVVIYIYYGKSDATTVSNGEGTFPFFDDFNDNSINYTKWNKVDTNYPLEQNGKMDTHNVQCSVIQNSTTYPYQNNPLALRMKIYIKILGGASYAYTGFSDSGVSNLVLIDTYVSGSGSGYITISGGSSLTIDNDLNGNHTYDIKWNSTYTRYFKNETEKSTLNRSPSVGLGVLIRQVTATSYVTLECDYIFTRKF